MFSTSLHFLCITAASLTFLIYQSLYVNPMLTCSIPSTVNAHLLSASTARCLNLLGDMTYYLISSYWLGEVLLSTSSKFVPHGMLRCICSLDDQHLFQSDLNAISKLLDSDHLVPQVSSGCERLLLCCLMRPHSPVSLDMIYILVFINLDTLFSLFKHKVNDCSATNSSA